MQQAAEVIRKRKEDIMNLWEKMVKQEISAAEVTERLLLLNVLPNVLEDIALIMKRSITGVKLRTPENCEEIIEESLDHGRHRATTAHFTSKQIIKEHIVLHRVLIIILRSEKAYHEEVGILLSLSIETSMAHSIASFDDTLQDMREKLIGTLAHDIRNPLATANLGLSAVQYQDGEIKFNKIKEMLGRSLQRSIELVEDLLDAITVKSGEGVSLHFSECNIVEDAKLVLWEASEGFQNDFIFRCEEDEIRGIFASTSVRRVLENLLTNAVKYGSPDKPITVTLQNEAERVILKVHNHGNSINPEEHKNIFNFLNRHQKNSRENLKSWGIGLSFVKMAAEAHGGYVELESDDKNGTTFSVIFYKFKNEPGKKRAVLNFENAQE